MNAYVFADNATAAAVDALKAAVEEGGPVRVVCPLEGDHALYVALFDPDGTTLRQRLSEIHAVEGLTGVTSYVVDADAEVTATYSKSSFPTHAAVRACVGFAAFEQAGAMSAPPLSDLVVGVAVAEGGALLVEVTADERDVAEEALRAVVAAVGAAATTAVGRVRDGAGFRTA